MLNIEKCFIFAIYDSLFVSKKKIICLINNYLKDAKKVICRCCFIV